MLDFTHLHVHTQYSLLDGASKIGEILDRAAELGYDTLAITDHGVMYGAIEFYTEAQKRGIRPIIGCEVYTAPRSRHSKVSGVDSDYGHLVLLCRNNEGYKNLVTLVSLAYKEGYYYKPRVDMELLKKYSKGLTALSGCLKGQVSACLASGNYDLAKKKAEELNSVFGQGNFYLEIQSHGIEEEDIVRDGMKRLSQETGIELVATNDVHYTRREDSLLQDVLTCIQTGKKLSDTDRLKFSGEEFYLKSKEEMYSLFSDVPDALSNTVRIAQRCNLTLDFDTTHLPSIDIDTDMSHTDYLRMLCIEGARKKYKQITDEVTSRMEYELSVIDDMGYTDYFLIVWDLIKYAKDNFIPIGPGRGSAAGSIVAYTLDITEIDPLEYDLIFERFLNPERVSMPDIDIDICNERRDEVRDYVTKKYGESRVAGIVTFGTLAARAAVRDIGRVLGTDASLVDKVAKLIPEKPGVTIKDALEKEPNLKILYDTTTEVRKLIDLAERAEGIVRHTSTHAAGVVISDRDLTEYVPVQTADNGLITQYTMSGLEKIGLLKMDFLGLRNLTIIDNTVKLIEKTEGISIDITSIDYNDKKTFDLISRGDTDGVFQLENPGLKAFLRKFRPKNLGDIIATTSIYRPGPMEQIPQFLKNVENPDNIKYIHPLLEDVLKPTYGTIIYQEQVMSIVRILAGYSFSRADIVRKAMAKKIPEQLIKERDVFINGLTLPDGTVEVEGALRRGIDIDTANSIFDKLLDFANYAFNKSHAACYARVAYRTAYLKANYPTQYLSSLLESLLGNSHKTFKYVTGFARYGIKLLPPDINKSFASFTCEGKNIRFGLSALKNVGMILPTKIAEEREKGGLFTSFEDFVSRISASELNKRSVEVLIKCGVFDSIFPNRRVLLLGYERLIDSRQKDSFGRSSEQISLFGEYSEDFAVETMRPDDAEDFSLSEKLAFEHSLGGMYLSGNPLSDYFVTCAAFSNALIYSVNEGDFAEGTVVSICGVISRASSIRTKNGVFLFNMSFSDYYDTAEISAFESVYKRYAGILTEGRVLLITAGVRVRNGEISLSLVSAIDADTLRIGDSARLYIKLTDRNRYSEVSPILSAHKGDSDVCIYFEDTNEKIISDKNHGVKLDNDLIEELWNLLGAENVKVALKK